MGPDVAAVASPPTALVLSGSVAKGAFQAGVLEVLAGAGLPIARIVAASAGSMNGVAFAAGVRYGRPALAAAVEGDTTFEYVTEFIGASFDSSEGRRRLITAVTASAAFPLLFSPVDVDPVGPCVDGGAVNNAPVSYGLDSPEVTRVIVVTDS